MRAARNDDQPGGGRGSGRGSAPALALLLMASLAPGVAAAQGKYEPDLSQFDLETLLNTPIDVSTATKVAQKSYEAPAIITTVTRDQIAVWGHRSIAELLGHLLGFYLVDDHTTPNVAVRGISGGLYSDSSIIKVLINGHSVASPSTGGNWLGPELIPLSAVERVEIIRGPVSALYGADAFLGVVNIETRAGASVSGATGWVTAGRVGTSAANDIDLSLGLASGMVDAMVAFRNSHQDLSGLELPDSSPAESVPAHNFGARTAHGLHQDARTAIATVTLRPRPGSEIGAFAYWSQMNRGSEFGSLFQLANGYTARGIFSENRVTQWQFRGGLLLGERLSDRLTLSLRAAYFQGGPGDDNRVEVGSDFYYVRRRFYSRGTDLDAHLVVSLLPSLRVVTGASLVVDRERLPSRIGVAKQQIGDVGTGEVIESITKRGGRKTFVNAGAYLQGTWDVFGSYLGLTGGLRYDRHNVYGGQLSRRIGLVSSVREGLHLKLLHGSAFKAPSPLLLYAVPSASGDVTGNEELKPQYVNTVEFQVEYEATYWLNLSTDVAYNLVRDKTEFTQQQLNKVARNLARARTLSWESLVAVKAPQWLQAHVSLELQSTVQQIGQEGFVGEVVGKAGNIYPELMLHSGVVVQPPASPVRAAALASFVGRRRASGNNILLNGESYHLPSYLLLEAKLSTVGFRILRDAAQEVSFGLSGKNLLDEKGPAPGFSGVDYPLSPRAFFFQLNLTL